AADEPAALARQARALLRDRCYTCHSGEGSSSGKRFDVLRDETLKAALGKRGPVVIPGDPEKSKLYTYVRSDRMPETEDKLTAGEKELLKKWIEAGAPAFPVEASRAFITLVESLTAVRDDLRGADARDRPFRRYFSLTHLYNNKRLPDEDLNGVRAALSKAINSLSWQSGIVLPEVVKGSHDTLYVIDVRKLGWDQYNLWNKVLSFYPYGVRYNNHPDKALRKLDEEIYDYTKDPRGDGCAVPVVRADWFAATATRPPLYHTLLYDEFLPALRERKPDEKAAQQGNPKRMTAKDLEEYLDVDIAKRFLEPVPEQIARAGFTRSGVSGQNRLVERSAAKFGAYWKSYDFKPDSARIKLTRFPLGPLNLFPEGKHDFRDQAFVHDGGEIIFNLPNHLQAYLLINGKDERIDEGPVQVVSDPARTSGTPAIVSGVSCMSCHAGGVIEFKDQVRLGNALFGKPRDKVEELYPEQEKMDRLLQEDGDRFLAAADKATLRFLAAGEGRGKSVRDFKEPVGEVARRYRLGYLDLDEIAAELFEPKPEELRALLGGREFKALGLDVLLTKGAVISRLEWEVLDGLSLMQRVARRLGGTPEIPVR
ncbi:MAG TPA: c-type cytochrome domain-containing protein, partial [Gemmataceae bacterium]|nr:c-type cytochrome domain-containing protein [Gemmataceae bacterium]